MKRELAHTLIAGAAGIGTLLAGVGIGVAAAKFLGVDPFFATDNLAGFIYWNQKYLAFPAAALGAAFGSALARRRETAAGT